jgi:hypothetical protein
MVAACIEKALPDNPVTIFVPPDVLIVVPSETNNKLPLSSEKLEPLSLLDTEKSIALETN